MQTLDNEFFEAYKRLERLCSDMYRCRSGVSQYIENMETQFSYGQFTIPAWEQSYKTLKHLRWVRNQIAHDSGQLQICEEYDIQDVNEFYDSIISGQDPLTRLRKYREVNAAVKKARPAARSVPARSVPVKTETERRSAPSSAGRIGCLAAVILILLALIACLLIRFL